MSQARRRRGLGEGLVHRSERHDRRDVEPVEHHGPLSPTRAADQRWLGARVPLATAGDGCLNSAAGTVAGLRPLVLAYQRAAMGDPTHPSSVPPHDAEPVPSLDDAPRSGAGTMAEEVIPLVEETATVGKRQVVTGRVRVQTVTDTIEELAHAEVQRETVEVTRVPIDKVVETAPEIRTEGDVTIVPIVEEVLVVEKRWCSRRKCTSGAALRPKPSRCRSLAQAARHRGA